MVTGVFPGPCEQIRAARLEGLGPGGKSGLSPDSDPAPTRNLSWCTPTHGLHEAGFDKFFRASWVSGRTNRDKKAHLSRFDKSGRPEGLRRVKNQVVHFPWRTMRSSHS